jgi:hypothetical protein
VAPLSNTGTDAFPLHHPLRDVQLYASIRGGSLPTRSFAEAPSNYVRFVNGKNPRPVVLPRNWHRHPGLESFDYMLFREPLEVALAHQRLRLVARDGEWALFAVCGGRHRPEC